MLNISRTEFNPTATLLILIGLIITGLALMATYLTSNLRNRNLFYETLKHMKLENQVRTDVDDPLQLLMNSLKKDDK